MPSRAFVRSALFIVAAALLLALTPRTAAASGPCCDPVAHPRVLADFDHDGVLDHATLHHHHVALHLTGNQTTIHLPSAQGTVGLAAIDTDRDGDLDLVSLTVQGVLRGWSNKNDGVFTPWSTGPPPKHHLPAAVAASTAAVGAWPSFPVLLYSPHVDLSLNADRPARFGLEADIRLVLPLNSHLSSASGSQLASRAPPSFS